MLFADDDRHAVVCLNHRGVGSAREDRKAVLAVNNFVDSTEIDQLFSANGEEVLRFLLVVAPLIKAAGRKDDAPIAQAI